MFEIWEEQHLEFVGIRLRENDYVVGSSIINDSDNVLVISENGYGKQTPANEYPIKGRGGKGVKTVNVTNKNGKINWFNNCSRNEDIY